MQSPGQHVQIRQVACLRPCFSSCGRRDAGPGPGMLLTGLSNHAPTTITNLHATILADGIFHLATWLTTLAGLAMLWLLERASVSERAKIQALVQDWEPAFFPKMMGLLQAHEALEESRRAVHQHLQAAGKALRGLPESESCASLFGLIDYLAQQTDILRGST